MQLPKKLTASGNVVVLLSLMYFITYVDRVNISTAAPAIKGEFGLGNTELGLIFSAFAYPYALFQVFGGWLGDKWGARLTLFLCGTIWAAATILTGLAGGLASLFGIRFMLGFWRGRNFPDRDAGNAELGCARQARFCSGLRAFGGSARQRDNAAGGGGVDCAGDVARLLCPPRAHQPRMGAGLGVVFPRRSAPAPGRNRGGTRAAAGSGRRRGAA